MIAVVVGQENEIDFGEIESHALKHGDGRGAAVDQGGVAFALALPDRLEQVAAMRVASRGEGVAGPEDGQGKSGIVRHPGAPGSWGMDALISGGHEEPPGFMGWVLLAGDEIFALEKLTFHLIENFRDIG